MKKLTSILLILFLLIGSIFITVSKWDKISTELLSFNFLRKQEDEFAKIKKENQILKNENLKLKQELSNIISKKESFEKYSSQLKEYSENLLSKYNELSAQYIIVTNQITSEKKVSSLLLDKMNDYNNILKSQSKLIRQLGLNIDNQASAYINEVTKLQDQVVTLNKMDTLTEQVAQINTKLNDQKLSRSPASLQSQNKTKVKIIYKKPVDKFN